MTRGEKVLVIGIGNPGRGDDGLGPALAAALEADAGPCVTVTANYQLVVEDAPDVAAHDVVVFVDAAVSGPAPLALRSVVPGEGIAFSSHHVAPQALLALARDLFGARTRGYTLAVRGYEFEAFCESLSPAAADNLAAAETFLRRRLQRGDFEEALTDLPDPARAGACPEEQPCKTEST
jgi:hydrogenase maturation protease